MQHPPLPIPEQGDLQRSKLEMVMFSLQLQQSSFFAGQLHQSSLNL
jgi:hypothetical protein